MSEAGKKRIAVVTGSRAEFGYLSPLLKALQQDCRFELDLFVTGSHLSVNYGYTLTEIEAAGFQPKALVQILEDSKEELSAESLTVALSMAKALKGFNQVLKADEQHLLIAIGDRYEMLATVICAYTKGVPVAHISGGELTYGSLDDGYRHCITKLSSVHLTSTELYRKRVIQLGEEPDTVFHVGELGLEELRSAKFLALEELEQKLDVNLSAPFLLVSWHPEANFDAGFSQATEELLGALAEQTDYRLIFTGSNADKGGLWVNQRFQRFVEESSEKASYFSSLGREAYLSLMKNAAGVIGNSSSGIIEAPSLKTASINIGCRQSGRVVAESVLNCDAESKQILLTLGKLRDSSYQKILGGIENPYERPNSIETVLEIIAKLSKKDLAKRKFYDLPK